MVFDLIVSFVQATIVVAALVGVIYIFVKNPKVFVAALFVALLLVGLCVAPTVAEDAKVKGTIKEVKVIIFDGLPCFEVTVLVEDGRLLTYYADGKIDVEGEVLLTLFGDEVLDVE